MLIYVSPLELLGVLDSLSLFSRIREQSLLKPIQQINYFKIILLVLNKIKFTSSGFICSC